MNKGKKSILLGALFGASAVMLGALAAHGLKPLLEVDALEAFKTASRYQLIHALVLMVLPSLSAYLKEPILNWTSYLLTAGILLFSGSIYLLCLGPLVGLKMSFLGPITPMGGLMLISAWILIGVGAMANK